jgi:hypothetical protein
MSDERPKTSLNQIPLQIDEATAKGSYSNFVIVSHTAMEVVVDFAFVHGAPPRAKVESRVILSPMQAKRLLRTLAENLRKYESQYGEIPSPPGEDLLH